MANAILGLLAETSIHAGASASEGVIDLPIQREAHTAWPVVFGSGVKGALRTAANDKGVSWEDEVFGPDTNNGSDHAGALAVGDARLLLLPVRSLTSHFKWVTCPALLQRFQKDCARMQLGLPEVPVEAIAEPLKTIGNETEEPTVIVHKQQEGQAPERLFLEELSFTEKLSNLSDLISLLAKFIGDKDAEKNLKKQLAIVSNSDFVHLAKFATPVTAHIAIDNKTKIVKQGALWYEETLPPETILYVCLQAQNSRKKDSEIKSKEVLDHITHDLLGSHPYLQIGGNETVGMGWCKVQSYPPTKSSSNEGGE